MNMMNLNTQHSSVNNLLASPIGRVAALLASTRPEERRFPPTTLFNETWMLRLVIDWYDRNRPAGGLLSPAQDARWYSEALLSSRFLRGKANEGHTNADAVIGHFDLKSTRGDIALRPNAEQFVVIEAKMRSPLSSGTTNAPGYNQAARNVACMAHLIDDVDAETTTLTDCRFIVLAPTSKLETEIKPMLEATAIVRTIAARALLRDKEICEADTAWVKASVETRLATKQIRILPLSWEDVLNDIRTTDPVAASELNDFYQSCLLFNGM